MHAHQRFFCRVNRAFDQREMRLAPDAVAVGIELEFTMHGFDGALRSAHDQ